MSKIWKLPNMIFRAQGPKRPPKLLFLEIFFLDHQGNIILLLMSSQPHSDIIFSWNISKIWKCPNLIFRAKGPQNDYFWNFLFGLSGQCNSASNEPSTTFRFWCLPKLLNFFQYLPIWAHCELGMVKFGYKWDCRIGIFASQTLWQDDEL